MQRVFQQKGELPLQADGTQGFISEAAAAYF